MILEPPKNDVIVKSLLLQVLHFCVMAFLDYISTLYGYQLTLANLCLTVYPREIEAWLLKSSASGRPPKSTYDLPRVLVTCNLPFHTSETETCNLEKSH